MTSAFIIQVHPQLQSDPNEETAALLRVLIHKIDNTTFGDNVPAVPQWSGPPRIMVQVQAILYASLAASLFSAFLAMLGKQWLNRYASIDVRGSAIERYQNRQRKLDGIVTWYFGYVMESLPLMLQFALLLLGCALSLYLWGINTTIALVVLGVTSFGVVFYAFIIFAGAVYVNCPYQTPGAQILRYLHQNLPPVPIAAINRLETVGLITEWWHNAKGFKCSAEGAILLLGFTLVLPIFLLFFLSIDACRFMIAIVRASVNIVQRVCGCFWGASDPQTVVLDLQCIIWVLQTSLDKVIQLLTLELLTTMTTVANSDPALFLACFNVLVGCMSVFGDEVVITQGSEELAEVAGLYCLHALFRLGTADPTLSVLKDVRQRHIRTFPIGISFEALPSDHSFCAIHATFHSPQKRIQWKDCQLPSDDHIILAHNLAELAHSHAYGRAHKRSSPKKVPRWILRFAFHRLSQNPLPPTSVVIDCLLIIAIDLGCAASNTTTQDERYVNVWQIFTILTGN